MDVLEAVAKCVPLATYRLNRHSTAWEREVQLHNLAQGRFNSQHGCDPGFADIHGIPLQHTTLAGIDSDIDLNFEPGPATGVGNCTNVQHPLPPLWLDDVPKGFLPQPAVSSRRSRCDSQASEQKPRASPPILISQQPTPRAPMLVLSIA